jgi:hypothetical protein
MPQDRGVGQATGSGDAGLVVPRRFRGPATSGNGGWTSGALAQLLAPQVPGPAVRVRLSAPPPLEVPLMVTSEGDTLLASADGRRVLEAVALDDGSAGPPAVPPVPYQVALAAGDRYPGLHDHPFPECFACGTGRAAGDGLRLRPGPPLPAVPGVDVAAAWDPGDEEAGPDGVVEVPVLWAALDCPGGWSVDIAGRPMVLGTMTARVLARPRAGDPCVVTGRAGQVTDRKALTATSLYGPEGELLAFAAHVWVAVDPATFGRAGMPS